MLLLSACQIPGPGQPVEAQRSPGNFTFMADPAQDPINDTKQNAPVPEVVLLEPAPPPVADPERLLGLDRQELAALLGQPELVRREPPAEVWQFRDELCVFDVFLYPESGQPRVTYLEARDKEAHRVDAGRCLGALLQARGRYPLG